MGRRGPKPLPSKVLAARCSTIAAQRAAHEKAPEGEPTAPAFVLEDARARAAWQEALEHLRELGTLSKVDSRVLGALASIASLHSRLASFVAASTLVEQDDDNDAEVTADQGPTVKVNAAIPALLKTTATLRQLCAEFGLTPAARAGMRLGMMTPDAPNAKARFFDVAGETPPAPKRAKRRRR